MDGLRVDVDDQPNERITSTVGTLLPLLRLELGVVGARFVSESQSEPDSTTSDEPSRGDWTVLVGVGLAVAAVGVAGCAYAWRATTSAKRGLVEVAPSVRRPSRRSEVDRRRPATERGRRERGPHFERRGERERRLTPRR